MTEQRDPQAKTAADPELEVRPEVIQDLDVTDADNVIGGAPCGKATYIEYTFHDTL